jgi:tRNA A58 N-methylase Trm61
MHLAHASKHVTTVEARLDHHEAAMRLVAKYRRGSLLDRIQFHHGPFAQIAPTLEGEFDAGVLDCANIPQQLPHMHERLRSGGRLVCYVTNVSQVLHVMAAAKGSFVTDRVVEVDWRDWVVQPTTIKPGPVEKVTGMPPPSSEDVWICRPTHQPTGHTGFLLSFVCAE